MREYFATLRAQLPGQQARSRRWADAFRAIPTLNRWLGMCRDEATMNNEKRSQYFTKASILELLSDDEVARVTTAESLKGLSEGDEYIDLENLDKGVCVARGVVPSMSNVIARKTVLQHTWGNILTRMSSSRIAP